MIQNKQALTNAIEEIIREDQIPGITMGLVDRSGLIYSHSSGVTHQVKKIQINDNTIYDLASLTKIIATTTSILVLIEKNLIKLDDPITSYVNIPGLAHVRVRDLLQHSTGLPAFYPFYRECAPSKHAYVTKIAELATCRSTNNQVIYSDLNFMLLAFIVEEVSKQRFDVFTSQEIFKPLQMVDTGFNPSIDLIDRIAATEYREEKSGYDHGYVHDENAFHLEGISGHAGLFSTLADLATYAQMILDPSSVSRSILSEETIRLSINERVNKNVMRGLGWHYNDQHIMGEQFPTLSFGHTGFTGTSIWFDEHRQLAVIILTNRVHYGRECQIAGIRKKLSDLAYDSFK